MEKKTNIAGENDDLISPLFNLYRDKMNENIDGENSRNDGLNTKAIGTYSHAEGNNSMAIGQFSHAEGFANAARGNHSHAEGQYTMAKGLFSHSEGHRTNTQGQCSHAEGLETLAKGAYSHTEGHGTVAVNPHEHAEGLYNYSLHGNNERDNTLHTIGIGKSYAHRKNAVQVMQNGDIYIIGIGGFDGTNYDHAMSVQEMAKRFDDMYERLQALEDIVSKK